jgi:hypothetical protein
MTGDWDDSATEDVAEATPHEVDQELKGRLAGVVRAVHDDGIWLDE